MNFFSRFRWFWTTLKKNLKKNWNFFWGGHQGAKFFFQFLIVSGHSELLLIFCKINPIGGEGQGGPKILFWNFTRNFLLGLVRLAKLSKPNKKICRCRRTVTGSWFIMPNAFGMLSSYLTWNKENLVPKGKKWKKMSSFFLFLMILKNVQKIFEIFYWGGGRGVIKGQFFFSISCCLSHSKSILIFPIFCKIDPIGGGTKNSRYQ